MTFQRQILTTKTIDRLLQADKEKLRTKAVQTPNAQFTTLCADPLQDKSIELAILQKIETVKKQSKLLAMLMKLMLANGLRISEVLQIKSGDISTGSRILIRGKKRSFDRVIDGSEFHEYLQMCRNNSIQPFAIFDRYHVYREFKKLGISIKFNGNKKNSVTHALRHIAGREIKNLSKSVETTGRALGHKSFNSTKHYTGEQK